MPEPKPTVGRIVHYVSRETNREWECLAAIIVKVHSLPGKTVVDLVGFKSHYSAEFVNGAEINALHFFGISQSPNGNPMRGMWHWPEREEN